MKTPNESAIDIAGERNDRPAPSGSQVDDRPPQAMSSEDRAMVLRGLEEARNGDFATEEEVRATLARFRG